MPLSAPPNCRRTVGTKSSGQNPRGRSRFRVSHSSASRSLGDQATPPCADVQLTAVRQHCVSVSHSPREKTSQKHITPDVLVRHVSSSLQSRDRASGSSCPRTSPHATVQPAGTHGGGGGGCTAHRGAPVYIIGAWSPQPQRAPSLLTERDARRIDDLWERARASGGENVCAWQRDALYVSCAYAPVCALLPLSV